MRASKEYRRLINWLRRRWKPKNGVLCSGLLDQPVAWVKDDKSKRHYVRAREKTRETHSR